MGHEGMRASLVSREVIADSVEPTMHAERLDGSVLLAGCDKSLPGMLHGRGPARSRVGVPLRRLDPSGRMPDGRLSTVQDVFEAVGARTNGLIDDAQLQRRRDDRLPEPGLVRRHVHR